MKECNELVSILAKSVETNKSKNGRRRETKNKQEITNLKSQISILKSQCTMCDVDFL